MSKHLIITPSAQAGADEAASDYEQKSAGLGTRFVHAVENVLNRIADNPLHFGLFKGRTRFAIVRKFPFLILFINQRHRIVITAIVPSKSNPASWKTKP